MTVSNPMDLRVARSVELLDSLQRTASDFAGREEALTREFRDQRYKSDRKARDLSFQRESSLTSQIEREKAAFDAETERIRTVAAARKSRIEKTAARLLRTLPQRAKDERGRRLANLQMRKLTAERAKAAGLEAVDSEAGGFAARLDQRRGEVAALQRTAEAMFAGYRGFSAKLQGADAFKLVEGDFSQHYEKLKETIRLADEQLAAFGRLFAPKLFRAMPLPAIIPLVLAVGFAVTFTLGFNTTGYAAGGGVAAALLVGFGGLYLAGRSKGEGPATEIAKTLAAARGLHGTVAAGAAARHESERKRVADEFERASAEIKEKWTGADTLEADFEKKWRSKYEAQAPRLLAKADAVAAPRVAAVEVAKASRIGLLSGEADARKRAITEVHDAEVATLSAAEKARWDELSAAWEEAITPLTRELAAMNAEVAARFPAWTGQLAETWTAPKAFSAVTKFGRMDADLAAGKVPSRLDIPGGHKVSAPLCLAYPQAGALLFEEANSGSTLVMGAINNIILRLLATTPPGKITFTIIDPVGLGQNFAGVMHLADYEEALINRRIWTQREQIEDRLSELNEHIEKVIQMYLRNEYATITEYNEQAGSVAEKYHFLVVADFPAVFSETAAKRLQSIAMSGARCGVFTLIHWDPRQPIPDGFVPEEIRKHSICIRNGADGIALLNGPSLAQAAVAFDPPPGDELALALVQKIGKASIDSNRVEVPFSQIAPAPEAMWTGDTTNELRVAIGRTGATKQQMLAIGKGTRQHALFAGKTGSGKSTLFHVIITNLALTCSPDQVEFYLVDFKKGVEFKCYAEHQLPHARVIAIESDREFGLSVLHRVDEELKRRGDIFRKLGVQDIPGYKRSGATEPMPRSLLLIDEFQEFFTEDDQIAQAASVLFDRIVRQGRAFGIHVILGSQTLGGAFTLARATMGQMVIRVALQCNEADAYLIMDENNAAPRLLSRPGEGIYNDAAGAMEGNSPFQVVWLGDEERDGWLEKVRTLADERGDKHAGPIVFEGNAPAELRENYALAKALDSLPAKPPASPRCWLGAPNSIKGPTEAVFHRQSGNHMLIVGQRDEAVLSMLGVSLISLAAQFPIGSVKIVLFNSTNPGTPDADFLDRVIAGIPHGITVARVHDAAEAVAQLAEELNSRISGEAPADAPPVFAFVHGLQRYKKLRNEDDFDFGGGGSGPNAGAQLATIITEGASHGVHLIVSLDTFNNVGRFISRKALTEFEIRVVFQMSANDSASLIDSPKASTLGLHRALLHNEHEGTLETFRPYALPDAAWLGEVAGKLDRRGGSGNSPA
jgi:DNA segregation ATPase FtsK/SpoIIIE, S-DNA-T family